METSRAAAETRGEPDGIVPGVSGPDDKWVYVLAASPARRVFGIGMLVALGALLVWVGAAAMPSVPAALAFWAAGAATLWSAALTKSATSDTIRLSRDGLYSSDGVLVAELDNVAGVEFGLFAFKPSNGFALRLKRPMRSVWRPGLWWRIGRRVGVGGVTPRAEAKIMAETIAALLNERAAKNG